MKKNLLVVACAVVFFAGASFNASAEGKKKNATPPPAAHHEDAFHARAEGEPDTDSCGLGWQVTQKKTLSATTTRATTNVFVPPSFGMTTGTLGCAQHPLSKRDEEALIYAFNNFDNLSIEMAEGRGEFLTGFARTLGCDDRAMDSFSQMTQSHYLEIMNGGRASSLQMFENVKSELKSNALCSG